MNKLQILVAATFISLASMHVYAEPAAEPPPVQIQKDQVPDSTANGNYLEPQADENGATQNTTDKHHKKANKTKGPKATNIEKSKKVTETPENGGAEVKPQ